MSKRKVKFAEEVETPARRRKLESIEVSAQVEREVDTRNDEILKKSKHSLDSDEEDIVDDGGFLKDDDIEGQEDQSDFTLDKEDNGTVSITPFNLNEEMEEGHFDAQGMYIFKREDDIHDNWLDNINWAKVKEAENKKPSNMQVSMEGEEQEMSRAEVYEQMLILLKPNETVAKALRRLGGNKTLSASERWKKKKESKSIESSSDSDVDKTNLLKLTALADELVSQGEMGIYQDTYEKISYSLKNLKKTTTEPELNIFSDNDDVGAFKKPTEKKSDGFTSNEEVRWEYKEDQDEKSKVQGPFSSEQMLKFVEENKFGEHGVYCRRVSSNTQFNNSKRIDFDLYL